MGIKLHWYLPTHGDGRTLMLAGDSSQTDSADPQPAAHVPGIAAHARLPRPGGPRGRAVRLRRRAYPDRYLV